MMHRALLATVGTLMLVVATVAVAAPPTLLTYQGALTDAAGNPANATYSMTFGMYNGATGGAAVWSETIAAVKVVNGVFTVVLGGTTPLPAGLTNCKFLQVSVAGTPMFPRHRLTSVPYALEAANATTAANAVKLNGQLATYYQNASNLTAGTLAIARLPADGITSGKIKNGGVAAVDLAAGAVSGGAGGVLTDGTVTGADLAAGAVSGGAGGAITDGSVTADDLGDNAVTGEKIANGAVTGPKIAAGSVVSGTTDWQAVFEADNNSSSGGAAGLRGRATGGGGGTYGVIGEASTDGGTGVYGRASAGTGTTYGVKGDASSDGGTGVYGLASSAIGWTYGVRGDVASTVGIGVMGWASAGTGNTIGIRGEGQQPGRSRVACLLR